MCVGTRFGFEDWLELLQGAARFSPVSLLLGASLVDPKQISNRDEGCQGPEGGAEVGVSGEADAQAHIEDDEGCDEEHDVGDGL